MALDGNGRWAYLDPKLGAMHAVAEAARKVAMTGATPVAATNCLNFGNPEKPEIMAQLSAAIDGIAEACTALGTPITGGNVSLYNETRGEGIYPTPVLGIVGILDDVTKAVPADFQAGGRRDCAAVAGSERRTSPNPNLKVPFPARSRDQCRSATVRCWRCRDGASIPRRVGRPTRPRPRGAGILWFFGVREGGSRRPLGPAAAARSGRRSRSAHAACGAGRAQADPLRPRHLRRRHRGCAGAGGFPEWTLAQPSSRISRCMVHPLFGLFAEPASTVLVTSAPDHVCSD